MKWLKRIGIVLGVLILILAVGKTEDIRVGKITVTPDLLSLLVGPVKIIRSVEIDGLVLTQKAIEQIPAWTKTDGKPQEPPAVRVERIKLDQAIVKLEKATFGPFDARLNLTGDGNLESASLTTGDGKLTAFIKPSLPIYVRHRPSLKLE